MELDLVADTRVLDEAGRLLSRRPALICHSSQPARYSRVPIFGKFRLSALQAVEGSGMVRGITLNSAPIPPYVPGVVPRRFVP